MRVIETVPGLRAVAVSADGRLLAASGTVRPVSVAVVHDLLTGERLWQAPSPVAEQLAFTPNASWLAASGRGEDALRVWRTADGEAVPGPSATPYDRYAGGMALAPDGKHIVASRHPRGEPRKARLDRWGTTNWKPAPGFDGWLPFERLVFSPDGQFVAGINPYVFEVRFAASGGIAGRVGSGGRGRGHRPIGSSFAPDSEAVLFGWDNTILHVMRPDNGRVSKTVQLPPGSRAAAFAGGGRFGTAGDDGRVRLWDSATGRVVAEYDWGVGPLACLTFTADGACGIAGAESGTVVVFDVDG